MSKEDENKVADLISNDLSISFESNNFDLDGWGKVDKWVEISSNVFLFLEVESKQKHPNTNVNKLWPYLDCHQNKKVILIQAYFSNSPGLNSNRGKLSEWTAKQLESIFKGRFYYFKFVFQDSLDIEIKNQIKDLLNSL